MTFIVTAAPMGGFIVNRIIGPRKAIAIAHLAEEELADRVAQLLDQHGLIDTPVDLVPPVKET